MMSVGARFISIDAAVTRNAPALASDTTLDLELLHFNMAINNFGLLEYMRHTKETDEVFPHAYSFSEGMLHPGDKPGHGVDFDEKMAAKFPYERAYLPVNRKLDGTMWNW